MLSDFPTTNSTTFGIITCKEVAAVAKFSKNSTSVGRSPSTMSVTTFKAINGVFERAAVQAMAAASMSFTDASDQQCNMFLQVRLSIDNKREILFIFVMTQYNCCILSVDTQREYLWNLLPFASISWSSISVWSREFPVETTPLLTPSDYWQHINCSQIKKAVWDIRHNSSIQINHRKKSACK